MFCFPHPTEEWIGLLAIAHTKMTSKEGYVGIFIG